jgi:hypothetical protein
MAGIELVDGTLVVDREPNVLDELAIRFTAILDDLGIEHVYVSGYLAILTGRSRATEDIDVLLERIDGQRVAELARRLDEEGLWGPAMPLDRMEELLEDNIWVAEEGEMVPHLEVKFVDDRFDRASLEGRFPAYIGGAELPVGPLELQIAYKLWMGSQTDFEDAVHLYTLFEESLRTGDLEGWVDELGVEEEYERLERA